MLFWGGQNFSFFFPGTVIVIVFVIYKKIIEAFDFRFLMVILRAVRVRRKVAHAAPSEARRIFKEARAKRASQKN
tara:strand:- start:382 stop:606 length:225 start_codon:yes stop_codon:yes gene_type:complete